MSKEYKKNPEDIKNLKENFFTYLKEKYPEKNEDRHREDKNWAFTHYRHNIGIDFWESLKSEKTLEECFNCYYNVTKNGGFSGKGVKNPLSDAKAYMASVRRLKQFMDEIYGGVENYLKMNIQENKTFRLPEEHNTHNIENINFNNIMTVQDLIEQQNIYSKNNKMSKMNSNNHRFENIIDEKLSELWWSNDENEWNKALNRYWNFVKKENFELETKLAYINTNEIEKLSINQFYNFLHDEYFVWKYTDSRWLKRNREYFSRYVSEEKLYELSEIKEELFSFNLNDLEWGLKITSSIKGLGVAGGSGLLALLFPAYFATVDQFLVKALSRIEGIKERDALCSINPEGIKISEGVMLIEILKEKARDINDYSGNNSWTPRKIDMILWTYGR